MGRETPRRFLRKIEAIYLFILVILFLLIPLSGFSVDEPDYDQEWVKTLKEGNAREKIYALHYPPASLDCCKLKKDPNLLNPILNALKDKDHSVRETAVSSLNKIGYWSKECCKEIGIIPRLIEILLKDRHPRVRREAAKTLGHYYKNEQASDALIAGLRDKDLCVRLSAVFSLGEMGSQKAVGPLLALLEDATDWRNNFLQQECVIAIRKIESKEAFHKKTSAAANAGTLQGARAAQQARQKALETGSGTVGLDDQTAARVISAFIRKFDNPNLKPGIIRAISDFKVLGARELLVEATQDPNDRVRELAVQALIQLSLALREMIDPTPSGARIDDPTVEVFIKLLNDPAIKIRAQSVEALGRSNDSRAVGPLIEVSKDAEEEIKALSAEALGRLMDTRAIGPLIEASQDTDEKVREKVIVALRNFSDERILDVAIHFIMNDPKTNLRGSAAGTFISVAQKTAKERVFVYRKNGMRYVSKNRSDIPWGVKVSERLVHPTAVGKLIDLLGRSNEEGMLSALYLLSQFEDERIEGVLVKHLDDPSPQVRGQAISLIPNFSNNSVVPRLILVSKDKNDGLREKAVRALGEFQDKRALDPLIERLGDVYPEVRAAALDSLKTYDDLRLSDLVIKLLSDDSSSVRKAAVSNIKERRDRKAVEALALLLNDADNDVANLTVDALEAIGDKRAVDPLIRALKGEFNKNREHGGDVKLRMNAARALGSMKDRSAVPALIECSSDKDPYLRRRIVSALKVIGDPVGLEAIKDIPKDELPPEIRSSTPINPKDVKPPPPSAPIPKEYSPGSGLSALHFGRHRETEQKQSPPKVIALLPLYQTKILVKLGKEPKATYDIKPSIAKLKSSGSRIRREAADTLGDIGNRETTDPLIPLLKDKDDYVRQAAARALGKLRDKKAVEPLIAGLKDPEVDVRAFSAWALGEIQDTRAIEPLCNSLFDQEQKVKDHSFEALRKFREPVSRTTMVNTLIKNSKTESSAGVILSSLIRLEGKGVVLKALQDPKGDNAKTVRNYINFMEANIYNVSDIATKALGDYPDRGMVISELSNYISVQTGTATRFISLLGRLKDRRVLPILLDTLKKRKDSYDRVTVVKAIGDLGTTEAIDPLLQILVNDKEYPGPRNAAAMALGKLGDEKAVDPLIGILMNKKEEEHVRVGAAVALGMVKNRMTVEPLINILKDNKEDTQLRVAAASSLGNIGDQRAIEPLQDALKDPSDYIKSAAQTALRKIRSPR
jgi:HEAT repeat protein